MATGSMSKAPAHSYPAWTNPRSNPPQPLKRLRNLRETALVLDRGICKFYRLQLHNISRINSLQELLNSTMAKKRAVALRLLLEGFGESGRPRTDNRQITIPALYRLSYALRKRGPLVASNLGRLPRTFSEHRRPPRYTLLRRPRPTQGI